MDLYRRTIRGRVIWYAECHYVEDGKPCTRRRSTRVRDDGSAKSRAAAEIAGRELEQSLALGKNRSGRAVTIETAIDRLIALRESEQKAQATIDIVLEKAAKLFEYFGSRRPLEECRDVQGYVTQALLTRAPDTVQREQQILAQAFRAVKAEPPQLVKIKLRAGRERWLPPDEQQHLLQQVPPTRNDEIVMYLHLGLSKSELFRITPFDCNFERREVRVRGTKTTGRDRLMPMSPEVHEILQRRQARTPMFDAWLPGNADRELRRWARRAHLEPISFNDLRRTFCTTLALAGVPPLHLMHLMGHTSTRMIERVYARIKTGDHMHAAVAKLTPLRLVPAEAEGAKRKA